MPNLNIPAFQPATDDLFVYSPQAGTAPAGATTMAQIQTFMRNNSDVLKCLVQRLWQPQVQYAANQVVWSPNMGPNLWAKVKTAGTTLGTEPVWSELVGAEVTDGTVVYTMCEIVPTLPVTVGSINVNSNYLMTIVYTDEDQETVQLVKTVNGVVADSAGNVTIDIPEPVIASEAEAKAGTNNTKFMTPLRVAQAIPFTALATTIGGASVVKPAVIVETKMSGANWYRRWSDGWLEQGGVVNMPISSAVGQKTVTLLKAYKNTNYVLTALPDLTNTDGADAHIELDVTYVNKTTTKFTLQGYLYDYSSTADMNWYACGQGA